jgi:TP901-1 family phage major tail protein
MASTGINNGTLTCLYYDGAKISKLTTNSVSISQALRDATTKDSAGWEESLEGLRSAEFTAEGYFAEDATVGQDEILADLITTRGTVTARWSSAVSGDKYLEAACYVTSYSRSGGKEESETFSVSLKAAGAVTLGTVS